MKKRTSFVANSSSSSFIIAYRNIDAEIAKIEPRWVKPMISKMMNAITRNGETILTIEALDKFFVNRYGGRDDTIESILEDDECIRERYDVIKTAIETGYIVADVDVDSHDEWSNDFFSDLPNKDFNEPITLLYGDC